MKKRMGFVSNSSSASYVIVGFRLTRDLFQTADGKYDDEAWEKFQEDKLFSQYRTITEAVHPDILIGVQLMWVTSDSWGEDASEYNIEELVNSGFELAAKLHKRWPDKNWGVPRVYTGTEGC